MTGYSIRLFGQLKKCVPSGALFLESTETKTVQEIKTLAERLLHERHADFSLESVALGNAERIFEETEVVPLGDIALLPPVCGG